MQKPDSYVECLRCLKALERNQKVPVRMELGEHKELMLLAFHSNHEGHELRIVMDGQQIFPPENSDG